MTDHQRDILREVHEQMEEKRGLVWGPEWMEEVAAALRALLAENAALKAHDPLAEMWRELAEYQPLADRDGHSESWRRMCSERTEAAAGYAAAAARAAAVGAAWDAATWAAADAASSAADAARDVKGDAACAVAEIRRAKEAIL
jgi:hypothetical protein